MDFNNASTKLGGVDYTHLRNPYAPEAWIPSELASVLRFQHYLAIGCITVYLWDMLQSLPDDYAVVFKRTFCLQTVVFLAIRISTFIFFLSTGFFLMTDLDNCIPWGIINSTAYIATHCSIALLFYFRVSAVYLHNRYIINFFRICWLGAVAGTITGPLGITYKHITLTRTCVVEISDSVQKARYPVGSALAQTFFDLLVCGFITYKLNLANRLGVANGGAGTTRIGLIARWRVTCGWLAWTQRTAMLGQRFMQDSQIYFLIIICVKIPEIVCFFAFAKSSKGSQAQLLLVFPDTVIVSILATKIYRQLKLGRPGLLDGGHQTEMTGAKRVLWFETGHFSRTDIGGSSGTRPPQNSPRLHGSSQLHSHLPVQH
ncbi:hypothetical protein CPB83DRAFT_490184 [Crepidotus variabilis]|uniref:Uncharacterized protein n=1 Tax=Crepidotus variabilis TaxID=179855 RepID=A0A9P6EPN8_9AGAR|nr:hypothetical protein CPB83DRAFT_490184 [Crepidotus variabilis]